ncbi:MAG: ABC transporter permease [Solirubrobacteraceae bacterium]
MSASASSADPLHRRWEDEFEPEVHVYEPHKVGLPPLHAYVHELWRRREFAFELARTRLAAQHYGTAFGMAWLILNPLLLGVVYFLLVDILRRGHHPPGFFAHLLGGIFVYYLFSDAVRPAVKSVTSGGKLILNAAFPRTLLPLAAVLTSIMRFLPTMVVYFVIHAASGLPFDVEMLWAVVPLLEILVFTMGICMLVAALQVYYRDVANFLPYLLRIWLYASPILWYTAQVPHGYKWLLYVNPLGGMLTAWNEALNEGITPGGTWLALGAAWAVVAFVGGGLFFVSRERDFAVRI